MARTLCVVFLFLVSPMAHMVGWGSVLLAESDDEGSGPTVGNRPAHGWAAVLDCDSGWESSPDDHLCDEQGWQAVLSEGSSHDGSPTEGPDPPSDPTAIVEATFPAAIEVDVYGHGFAPGLSGHDAQPLPRLSTAAVRDLQQGIVKLCAGWARCPKRCQSMGEHSAPRSGPVLEELPPDGPAYNAVAEQGDTPAVDAPGHDCSDEQENPVALAQPQLRHQSWDVAMAVERLAFAISTWQPKQLVEDYVGAGAVPAMLAAWLGSEPHRVSSFAAEGDRFGTDDKTVMKLKQMAGSASWLLVCRDSARMVRQLVSTMANIGAKAILWTEKLAADETSLPLTVQDSEHFSGGLLSTVDSLAVRQTTVTTTSKQASPSKVLQTVRHYSCLFEMPGGGEFYHFEWEVPVPLQIMSCCKADVYVDCFESSQLPLDDISSTFARRQRLCMTDGDRATGLALRAIEQKSSTKNFPITCNIHRVANMTKAVMSPSDPDISSMVNVALSLQSANSMRLFRQVFREIVETKLVYVREPPRQVDLDRTRMVLDITLPATTSSNRLKRAIILSLFNGNWFNGSVVEHKCTGCCADRQHSVQRLCTLGTMVFCGAAPPMWPRSRWTGAREAVNVLLLLQSCHGLLSHTYLRWAAGLRGGQWVHDRLGSQSAEAEADTVVREGPGDGGDGLGPDRFRGGFGADDDGALDDANVLPEQRASDEWEQRQLEQSRYRRNACAWLLSRSMHSGIIMARMCLGPLASLMDNYLAQAGAQWDRKQDSHAAAATMRHGEEDGLSHRTFRALLLLRGDLTRPPLEEVRKLMFDRGSWEFMPLGSRTAGLRSRIATMLSHAGSRISSLAAEHAHYPYKCFGLLEGSSDVLADEIQREFLETPCVLDAWSHSLISPYVERGLSLTSQALRAELAHTAYLLEADNAATEARHASIRRSIYSASLHTHTERVQLANAEWMLRMMRKVSFPMRVLTKRRGKVPASSPQDGAPKKRAGCGGSWRAFVREQSFGLRGEPDLVSISKAYKDLSPAERARLKQVGAAATSAAKAGAQKAFGKNSREIQRAASKRSFDEALSASMATPPSRRARLALPDMPASDSAEIALATRACSSDADYVVRLRRFKSSLLVQRRCELARARALDESLAAFEAGHTMSACLEASPIPAASAVALRQSEFVCRPGSNNVFRAFSWRPCGVQARVKQALRVRPRSQSGKALHKALLEAWNKQCTTFQYYERPSVAEAPRAAHKRPCHEYGQCVCQGLGPLVTKLSKSLDIAVKGLCGKGCAARPQLRKAEIALAFVGQKRVDAAEGHDFVACEAKWAHVSEHSFTPWGSEYHRMSCDVALSPGAEHPPERAHATFRGVYQRRRQMLDGLDLSLKWSVAVYGVAFSETLVADFTPNSLDLALLPGHGDFKEIWNSWGKRSRKAKSRRPPTWSTVLDELSVGDACDPQPVAGHGCEGDSDDAPDGSEQNSSSDSAASSSSSSGHDDCRSASSVSDSEFGQQSGSSVSSVLELISQLAPEDEEMPCSSSRGSVGAEPVPDAPGPAADHVPDASPVPLLCSASVDEAGARHAADVTFHLGGDQGEGTAHTLVWYDSGKFYAYCRMEGHHRCRCNRMSGPGRKPAAGRPLGFMYWWLQQAARHANQEGHQLDRWPSWAERKAARQELKALQGSALLMSRERPVREDEDSEPEDVP